MPVQCTCPTCGTAFTRPASKVGAGYCSQACHYNQRVECACFVCGKPMSRQPSSIKRRTYCSQECGAARWPTPPVEISEDGLTARIPLRGRDGAVRAYAIVDASDLGHIAQWRWGLTANGYVAHHATVDGKRRSIYLHRAILGLDPSDRRQVDHINRNRLDNRRGNLRAVLPQVNGQNHPGWRNASSIHRGVAWHKAAGKWSASITIQRKCIHLGLFTDEQEAARVARETRLARMAGAVD